MVVVVDVEALAVVVRHRVSGTKWSVLSSLVVDVDVIVDAVVVVDVTVGVVVFSVVLVIVIVVVDAGDAPPQPARLLDTPKSTITIPAVTADFHIAATRY